MLSLDKRVLAVDLKLIFMKIMIENGVLEVPSCVYPCASMY